MRKLIKMTAFHKLLFYSSVIPLFLFLILFESINIYDSAFILYNLSFFFSSAILVFWVYWYVKSINRSTIFVLNGLIIFSMWYRTGFDIYSRYYYVIGDLEKYKQIITSDAWSYRVGLQLLVLLWLLTWIVSRIFKGEEYFKGYRDEPNNDHYFDTLHTDIKPSILIIDDEEEVTNLLKSQIGTFDLYDIHTSNTLEDGFLQFKDRRYYLILLDLRFKGKNIDDVVDLCKRIREIDRFVFISIVTGYFDQAFNHALVSYIDDIFSKPFSVEDLKTKLFIWNLKYRRRIFYIKDLSLKVDCVKNAVTKMLQEQGNKLIDETDGERKGDGLYD